MLTLLKNAPFLPVLRSEKKGENVEQNSSNSHSLHLKLAITRLNREPTKRSHARVSTQGELQMKKYETTIYNC